jgi:hypothetical protein
MFSGQKKRRSTAALQNIRVIRTIRGSIFCPRNSRKTKNSYRRQLRKRSRAGEGNKDWNLYCFELLRYLCGLL